MNGTSEILGTFQKETEKALLVKFLVSWGDGKSIEKSLWLPKAVVKARGFNANNQQESVHICGWFVEKLQQQNAFHGYRMKFDYELL
ncbi:MAG: hypothetical protein J6X92_02760 [Bacteroidales bacterium]|nr:hypothetical protein [Bacteroidales bacterium]